MPARTTFQFKGGRTVELKPGMVFQNKYFIEKVFETRGGKGRVYEARVLETNLPVSIWENQAGENELLFPENEDQPYVPYKLHHLNLLAANNVIHTDEGQFIVSIPGFENDMETMLREPNRKGKPIPVRGALRWAEKLLEILKYLHAQSPPVFHRNIKPSNILTGIFGHLNLFDFGISHGIPRRAVPTPTSVSGFGLNYAPVEQLSNQETDAQSDLYAVAATLHHVLAGFDHQPPNSLERSTALAAGRPDPLPKLEELNPLVPVSLAETIRYGMAVEKSRRVKTAREFALRIEHQHLLLRKAEFDKSPAPPPEPFGGLYFPIDPETKFDAARVMGSTTPEDFYYLGIRWADSGNHRLAISFLDEALQRQPDFAFAFHNRGLAYHNQGNHELAIADFDEALRLEPDFAFAFNNRGLSHAANGAFDRAIADFTEAVRIEPEFAFAFFNRGISNEKKGDKEGAIADYRRTVELDPQNEMARNHLQRLKPPSFFQKLFTP